MDLLTYISDMSRRAALAEACGTSPEYLWQIARRWRGKRPSPELAATIERESERLGPERVPKEPLIFGPSVKSGRQAVGVLVDSRMSKRALRSRLGLASDIHLAKILKLPVDQVAAWPEEQGVPALPQVLQLLGVQEQTAADAAPIDPDAERVIQVQVA
ncbi:hypothetical protein LQE85_08625 [Stenotrophomonas rhizophila]|uniref:hypothetical protein n=1 Tax=Stenotrophomonas rhizophila TaxID=216778 RepID=UPI00201CE191|nr:hypothetical protein [Stenotrophomonas rhizophila]UQY89245.1 hypothetical protein LQE85_08625 [Stenotrophomonas rhizophila]